MVDWNFRLTELKLDNNYLETLNGALSGLAHLRRVNLSFNKLRKISPDDLIGLDELQFLDISHNRLTTLEETSKVNTIKEIVAFRKKENVDLSKI